MTGRANSYIFVVVPKKVNETFFDMVGKGCQVAAAKLGNVDCRYIGPVNVDAKEQAAVIRDLVRDPSNYNISRIDGIAVAVIDETVTGAAIDFASDAKIPVITFDADAAQSKRRAYVSTDDHAIGHELGKVLNQLFPEGGQFVIMTGSSPNFEHRIEAARKELTDTKWTEVSYSPVNCHDNITMALEQMWEFGRDPNVSAVIPVGGWPMLDPDPTRWKNFVDQNRHLKTVVADSFDIQIELIKEGYVDGLVGQLPFQIGELSAKVLMQINQEVPLRDHIYGPHLLETLRVPLDRPDFQVNNNYIGNLAYVGYTLFSIIAIMSLGFVFWTLVNRKTRVVRASQPAFMAMICAGTLIMGSAIIPLSIDDENVEISQRGTDIACQSAPWLVVLGFCTIFSALFSKTWRIVKILEKAKKFERIKIATRDVLAPYFALLAVNVITLICWTVINPLVYDRRNHVGRDGWNRVYLHTVPALVAVTQKAGLYLTS